MRLTQLNAAVRVEDLRMPPQTGWMPCTAIVIGNGAFGSTINGESASALRRGTRLRLKSLTITEQGKS